MNKILITASLEELPKVARAIIEQTKPRQVFVLDAPMGAGKTTLIKAIGAYLGVQDNVDSPTYSIVNEYQAKEQKVYHFDLYRLKNEAELLDIGFESYLEEEAYLFIEWAELALPFLDNYVKLTIGVLPNQLRQFEVELTG